MRLTGPNVFGPPENRADAIALLRAAVDGGVDHIDTAQYYGPNIVNEPERRSRRRRAGAAASRHRRQSQDAPR
jgi:aryl-alcohol dehydrogenase-like predicted oxidoreductase